MAMIVVDSHLHVWSGDESRYPKRLSDSFVFSNKVSGSVELLLELQAEVGVDKSVLVQSGSYEYDHSYLFDCCRSYPGKFASVCLIDPLKKHADRTLSRMVREERLGGLRLRPLQTPDDWSWLSDPATDHLWETADNLAIPINILILPNQIFALEKMVARFPRVKVIIDHMGRQYAEESPHFKSAESLMRLADYPNTYVKISALSAASQQKYPYADTTDLVTRIYKRFGARRLMWGTDFPYVQLNEGYAKARQIVEKYSFMSIDDKEWLLGRTALSLYNFD